MIACYPFRLHCRFYRSSSYRLISFNRPLLAPWSKHLPPYYYNKKIEVLASIYWKKSRLFHLLTIFLFGNLAKCSDFAENYRNDLEISSPGRLSEAVKRKYLTTKTAVSAADPSVYGSTLFPGSRGSRTPPKPIYIIWCILIPFPNGADMGHCTPLQPILCRQKIFNKKW